MQFSNEIVESVYFPKNALCNTIYTTHIKTPTCFGTQVPSSGIYHDKGVRVVSCKHREVRQYGLGRCGTKVERKTWAQPVRVCVDHVRDI